MIIPKISGFTSILLLLISTISCTKFLDEKSDKSLVVPTTLDDLQAILDDDGIMNNRITPSFGEASSDDYFLLDNSYQARSPNDRKAYIWDLKVYTLPNDWAINYQPIYNANICIEQIENIAKTPQNEAKWNNVFGSALFYRAYYFLQLAWTYAKAYDENQSNSDLGIVLRLTTDFNIASVRSSVKESYQRIIKDALEAATYLPINTQHVLRPSKAAAYGLLARTYLSMRKYDSALKYSNLCLSIKNDLLNFNTDINPSQTLPFRKFDNKEIIFYTEMSRNITSISTSWALIDTILRTSYNIDDLRRMAFFRTNGSFYRFKGTYTASSISFFSGIATDEMYLTRAECFARLNQVTQAMEDLNTLMITRWKNSVSFPTFTAIDATDALGQILHERRKELLMRGIRWMDIKRLNLENANIVLTRVINNQTYTLPPDANYYALPLPDDIINLTGMQQN